MKKRTETALAIGIIPVAIVAVGFFIYGCYWTAKTVSYTIFYKDMVQKTITEMVKPESLNK